MFENLHLHAKALHAETVEIFWIILPALVSILIVLEILRGDGNEPNISELLKRSVLCILLLISFDFTVNVIAMVSDGITHKLSDGESLLEAVKQLGPNSQGESDGLFDIREHIIYFFSIAAYLVAYIGFFASVALVNFVWAILYITAPLILPCFISRATAPIVGNLYRGLISVATWKILWTLLGSLLLKLAMSPKVAGLEDYFLSMVVNLLIGLSMLLIPLFTKSLISDGLASASSALAAAPGLVAAKAGSLAMKKFGRKALSKSMEGLKFAGQPASNLVTSRTKIWAGQRKLERRFNTAKRNYSDFGKSEKFRRLENFQDARKQAKRKAYQSQSRPRRKKL
jgi:hypothetical protein